MKELSILMDSLSKLSKDIRIGSRHLSLYMAMVQLWHKNNLVNPVPVSRRKLLALSHIGSIVTYHKYIKELEDFGYIKYQPSYHPRKGSLIVLL
jgi:replication initiation and membrane attachment protein DnaB